MEKLNPLELTLLQGLTIKYPTIGTHLPFLRVKDRVFTGVGMYSNFVYVETDGLLLALEINNGAISNNENIEIQGPERGSNSSQTDIQQKFR